MFRMGNMRFPAYFYSGFAWGARHIRFLAILAVLASPCGPCTCLDQFYKKVICHLILLPMVFAISRLLVSAAEANICGFGPFDLQWSRSITSWVSLLGWAASPLRALHHVTYCRTLLPGVPHIVAAITAAHFVLTVVIDICTLQLFRTQELVKLVSVCLGLSQKERLCSVVCHVTYCCDRFLGRRSVNLQGMPSPYCAPEIGVQLSFLCTHRSRKKKSFQTVSGRDNLDEVVDT